MTSFAKVSRPACTLWTVRDQILTGCSALTMENERVIARLFARNNLCHHFLAIAIHLHYVPSVVEAHQGRSLSKISAASAPKNVSGKVPSRKRPLPASEVESHHSSDKRYTEYRSKFPNWGCESNNSCHKNSRTTSGSTTLWTFVLKKIAGNIKKCAGCSKALKFNVVGFQRLDDQVHCTIWPLSFFQQGKKCLAVSNVNEALQLNPVGPKVSSKIMPDNSLIIPSSLRELMLERFQYDV